MNTMIDEMLERYSPKTNQEKNNVTKETIQEILLCGLSKSGFFDKAVFMEARS